MVDKYQIIRFRESSHLWFLLFVITVFVTSCQQKTDVSTADVYCDVDTTILDKKTNKFIFQKKYFEAIEVSSGGYITDQEYNSAPHSILLTGKKKYGFSVKYDNLVGNEHFLISVWRKDPTGRSALVVQGDKTRSLYIAKKEVIEKGKDGWEKIEIDLEVPPNISQISVYAWKINADSAFFDDLKIEKLPPKRFPTYAKESKLHLYFSDSKMQKFEEKRVVAFDLGVRLGDDDWMKGILSDEKSVMPIKARFKGDWLDHLMGSKWSFRIKMRDDYTFERMVVFSVQSPITRFYLNEYYAHKLFAQEDVLTTRYGFIPLYLNGRSLGVYAWEEHFAKQLIEFNLRREGPILKFDENPLWQSRQYLGEKMDWPDMPFYETSRVLPFGASKTMEKPALKAQFHIAQSLMLQYKYRKAPIDEIFNLEMLAKYWALIDVTNGRHGVAWHNQRMYYNPVICKLEPINFDNFTDYFNESKPPLISGLIVGQNDSANSDHLLVKSIFSSPKFMESYIRYLEKYSSNEFIETFMESQKEDLEKYEEMLQQEIQEYSFNPDYFYNNAIIIREKLPELKEKYESGYYEDILLTDVSKVADTQYFSQILPHYINAYYSTIDSINAELLIENFSGRQIKVIGIANKENRMLFILENPIVLNAYAHQLDDSLLNLKFFPNTANLVYSVKDAEDILYSEITPWEKNRNLSPYQELLRNSELSTLNIFDGIGDSLILRSGKYQINQKLLIPKGKTVVFEAGVELDMINQAAFISHSAVIMRGEKNRPIKIFSSDSSANSFSVLQAKSKSELSYVEFIDLNTLNYKGWTLTGAVNFYESDVDISNCLFESNHCEDALNIIRSDFHVTKSAFLHIFADAFDSDFCTGLLDYSTFEFVGNDAIDFSTSQISINECEIKNITDKGISGGEGSTLHVTNTNISACNIGAASKDLSMVLLENMSIKDCNYGLVALRKKPEYGAATLDTKNLVLEQCIKPYLIEEGSVLKLNGRQIIGIQKNVSALFY